MQNLRRFAVVIGSSAAVACGILQPAWSPSGDAVVIAVGAKAPGLALWSVADGTQRPLPVELGRVTHAAWLDADTLVALNAAEDGGAARGLWRVDGLRTDDWKARQVWAAPATGELERFGFGMVVAGGRVWTRVHDPRAPGSKAVPPAYVDLADGTFHSVPLEGVAILGAGPLGLFAVGRDGAEGGGWIQRVVAGDEGVALEPFAELPQGPAGTWLEVGERFVAVAIRSGDDDGAGLRALVFDATGAVARDVVLPFANKAAVVSLGPTEDSLWVVGSDPVDARDDSTRRDAHVARITVDGGAVVSWTLAELVGASVADEMVLGATMSPTERLLAIQCSDDQRGFVRWIDFRGERPVATVIPPRRD